MDVTFPGLSGVLSGTYTLSLGISPGSAHVEAPAGKNVGAGGDLTFSDGAGGTVTLRGCKIDYMSYRQGASGKIATYSILDRRWKWRPDSGGGEISGTYNFRICDNTNDTVASAQSNTIVPGSLRTPQQLADLCLQAMGESGADSSALAGFADSFPAVDWQNDNPAKCLAELCDLFGCRVCLNAHDKVSIVQTGQGSGLPSTQELEDSDTVDPPEVPDSITVVGGRTRYQIDWPLQAVGLDIDGSIKPLARLSYAPALWGADGAFGPNFAALNANPVAQHLAEETVFRWYQILPPVLLPDGSGLVTSIYQVLPIESNKVEVWFDTDVQAIRSQPAQVWGTWHGHAARPPFNGEVKTDQKYMRAGEFEIDTQHGIVIFEDFTYKWSVAGGNVWQPADMMLRVGCSFRNTSDYSWSRYRKVQDVGGQWNTGTRVEKHDEIVLCVIGVYTTSGTLRGAVANSTRCDAEASLYLQSISQEYQGKKSQEKLYPGIIPIDPTGAVQQVTWSVGPAGATTRASLNSEHSKITPPFKQRRIVEDLRGGAARNLQTQVNAMRNKARLELAARG